MKQLIVFLSIIAVCLGAWDSGLRVKFSVGLGVGSDFFFDVPRTYNDAIQQNWTLTQGIDNAIYPSLRTFCRTEKILCLLLDNTNNIAGLQIALAEDEFTDAAFDWETLGFTKWVAANSTGVTKEYWTIQQYFVSEETIQNSTRKNTELLPDGAVWLTGFNRQLDRVSATGSDIENSVFTRQACIPWMGRHFYYNMSSEIECTSSTIYPWFPLVDSGQLIGTGFMVFGKLPAVEGERDWFERPSKLAVQVIVPRGPECLYDLAETVGVVTMHIYYVRNPWRIGCFLW